MNNEFTEFTEFFALPYPSPLPVWGTKNGILTAIAKWGKEKKDIDSYRKALKLINKNNKTIGYNAVTCGEFKSLCEACFGEYATNLDKEMASEPIENYIIKMKEHLDSLVKGVLNEMLKNEKKLNDKLSGIENRNVCVKSKHVEEIL